MLTLHDDGSVTFRVYAPHAECVELLADFTGWERGGLVMSRGEEDGEREWWSLRVSPPPGDHAFCYLVDGRCWMPDYAAHGVERNAYGNLVSLVTVPAGRTVRGEAVEVEALARVQSRAPLAESWRIDGCCEAKLPWAG